MNKTTFLRRVLLFVLAACFVLGAFPAVSAAEAVTVKGEKPYEIAVAYDNSGSMFNGEGSWCYAKYAMEIFASMMDLSGRDKLTVFTMHNVTIDGGGGTKRIEVKSVADIDKIHKMVTTSPGGTPFDPVNDAYKYLSTCDPQNEKSRWLIVLTDGGFSGYGDPNRLQQTLQSFTNGTNINLQYIPFGAGATVLSGASGAFHTSPQINGKDALREELISICNKIFSRIELRDRLDGQKLTLDLSMKRIIVFVQGKGAEVVSLKDSKGKAVKVLQNSGKRTYSTHSVPGGGFPIPPDAVDQSGQVVTFDACGRGEYTLEYTNADSIQIFYEPDVTMDIEFINPDGVKEDFSDGQIVAGEYSFNVKLIDRKTGEDVTNHELLGGDVKFDSKVTYNGENPIELKSGGKIELKPGQGVDFDFEATYLDRYKLTDKDCPDLPDFDSLVVIPPVPGLTMTATVQQKDAWYVLKDHAQWKPIRLDLKMNSAPLTDEQLENATIKISFGEKDIVYHLEPLKGESAVNVLIGTDQDGKYTPPAEGKYTLTATAKATSQHGVEAETKDAAQAEFEINSKSKAETLIGRILLVLLIILAIILLLWFICSIPAMPKFVSVKYTADRLGGGNQITCTKYINFGLTQKEATFAVRGQNTGVTTRTIYTVKICPPDKFWGISNCSWIRSRGFLWWKKKPVRVKFILQTIAKNDTSFVYDSSLEEGDVHNGSSKSYDWTEVIHVDENLDESLNASATLSTNR